MITLGPTLDAEDGDGDENGGLGTFRGDRCRGDCIWFGIPESFDLFSFVSDPGDTEGCVEKNRERVRNRTG